MPRLKIGLVGCGAIGTSLAKAIKKDFAKKAELSAVYDIDSSRSSKISALFKSRSLAVSSLEQLIKRSQLVIEAASASCSWDVARKALLKKRDVMVMSIGGIVSRKAELSRLAAKSGARVYLPSGAISGVDSLKAAVFGKVKNVTLTTRKNPVAFKGVKYVEGLGLDLEKIEKDTLLFSGPASEAVKNFPQNINVAALLSIAGIGQDKTMVEILACPGVTKNIHEIRIESEAGSVFTRTENVLHPDNPKTSYMAVLAAVATLNEIMEPVKAGT